MRDVLSPFEILIIGAPFACRDRLRRVGEGQLVLDLVPDRHRAAVFGLIAAILYRLEHDEPERPLPALQQDR